jgi:hypothetical protein
MASKIKRQINGLVKRERREARRKRKLAAAKPKYALAGKLAVSTGSDEPERI